MKTVENIKAIGIYELVLRDRFGRIKKRLKLKNMIVNAGLALLSGLTLSDVGGTGCDYLALGTDNTAAAADQTALLAEISTNGGERTAGTGTQVTTTTTNDTSQLVVTWNFTGSLSLREIGMFNDPSAGTMLSRQVFSMDVVNGDSLQATYKIIFARA